MKIAFLGLDLPEGKVKYIDQRLAQLEKKFLPQKVTPFFVEFLKEDFVNCESIVIAKDKFLDLSILDMDKLEKRRTKTEDDKEKILIQKCLDSLEKGIPLCDIEFNNSERASVKILSLHTLKPVLILDQLPQTNILIEKVLEKSRLVFFYTAGKKEVRSWLVNAGTDIVSCAAKIHSDLARGFIKAEVINYNEFIPLHNMQEARSKGLTKLVDKDYAIVDGDIVEIRFNI